jgi:hypothetical protein
MANQKSPPREYGIGGDEGKGMCTFFIADFGQKKTAAP